MDTLINIARIVIGVIVLINLLSIVGRIFGSRKKDRNYNNTYNL